MKTDLDRLKEACDICIADRGKEDPKLSSRLCRYIQSTYGVKAVVDWDYALVDEVLDKMLADTI